MKEKMTGMQWVEKKSWVRYKVLPIAALLYALWLPQEWSAKGLSGTDEETTVMEITPQVQDKKDDIIGWKTAIQWIPVKDSDEWVTSWDDEIEPWITGWDGDDGEKVWDDGWDKGWKDMKWEKWWWKIDVHGTLRWWSDVTPLLWSVLSDKPALMLSIDVSHPKTGLWATLIRLDDFDKSMDSPASQVTILDMYWQKQIWKASVMLDGEYMTIDKLSGADSFTPIVWCTYDAWKWWTLDTWAWHCFQKWDDVDVVRLWITKKLDECLSLAAQGFYSSDLSKKFYGRVQADVKLWGWFGVQLSFIAKEWKITPTAWVLYKF